MARKLRAVFYARVSTEEEQQLNALDTQVVENREIIAEQGWELVGEYIDEGRTGTTTRRRTAYNQLLEDMSSRKFDIIVVKDQDRLQRNTKDWYTFVDRLVSNDLDLFIYLENRFFVPEDDALITGVKAILAEEYSRNLSKKMNNFAQRRLEKARAGEMVVAYGNNKILGYTLNNGKWEQVPEEIELCKFIWDKYEEYKSTRKVSEELNKLGYTNSKGNPFVPEAVSRVLKNEKAKGVLVLGKRHYDFTTKKEIKLPESEWVRLSVPELAYVSEERFERVQKSLASRTFGRRGVNNQSDPLSGKVFCAECGGVCWKNISKGYTNWICSTYLGKGKMFCKGTRTTQLNIEAVYSQLAENVEVNKTAVRQSIKWWLESLRESLSVKVDTKAIEKEIKALEERRMDLADAYLEKIMPKDIYAKKSEEVETALEELKAKLEPVDEHDDVKEIEEVLKNLDEEIDAYINANDFTKNKVEWLISHTKRVEVVKPAKRVTHYIIELDLLAGAIIAGKDFQLFVHTKAPLRVQMTESKVSAEIRLVA